MKNTTIPALSVQVQKRLFVILLLGVLHQLSLSATSMHLFADSISISGRVTYVTGMPMENVTVGTSDGTTSYVTQTDAEGKFIFSNLPAGQAYSIGFYKEEEPAVKGVSVSDLILLRQHVLSLGVEFLVANIIAMDYNKSGSITTFDLVEASKTLLQIENDPDRWLFISAYHSFPNHSNPWMAAFPDTVIFPAPVANRDIENVHFIAFKIGDVNQDIDYND